MGMGYAPTWLRQVSPLLHKTTFTTACNPKYYYTDVGYVVVFASTPCLLVARDVRLSLLLRNRWLLKEKYAELCCIECCSLAQFAKDLFNGVFVEGLFQGNITSKVHRA